LTLDALLRVFAENDHKKDEIDGRTRGSARKEKKATVGPAPNTTVSTT